MTRMKSFAATTALLAFAAFAPARLSAQEKAPESKGPDVVVLQASRGTVTFKHGAHATANECVTCHHASKPEKAATAPQQKCSDCHTTPPTAPMTTNLKAAFHNTAEKTGTCFDCHAKQAEAGKKVPATCNDCHVKPEGTN